VRNAATEFIPEPPHRVRPLRQSGKRWRERPEAGRNRKRRGRQEAHLASIDGHRAFLGERRWTMVTVGIIAEVVHGGCCRKCEPSISQELNAFFNGDGPVSRRESDARRFSPTVNGRTVESTDYRNQRWRAQGCSYRIHWTPSLIERLGTVDRLDWHRPGCTASERSSEIARCLRHAGVPQ